MISTSVDWERTGFHQNDDLPLSGPSVGGRERMERIEHVFTCVLDPLCQSRHFPQALNYIPKRVERVTRLERATSSLARKCSTN